MSFVLVRLLLDDQEHVRISLFQFLAWTLVVSYLLRIIVIVSLMSGDISTLHQIPLTVH